ncbi:MAG: erythromycin esterase family protein [Alphaproteobacteria bacterium]|nr:MAG: erythromycin esterase family protein [Alphaproteobacteria bacterium]
MQRNEADRLLVKAIEKNALPLTGGENDYDILVNAARGRRFVLLGEATHGTQEFYRTRAEITQRLIEELGFDAVAVEADWPDAYAINRYVSNEPGTTAKEALGSFERFPAWMWRNTDVQHFIEWLQAYNVENRWPGTGDKWPAGFYGLDLYSMTSSIHAVLDYLGKVDPAGAARARERYSCLDHFLDNPASYGYAAEFGIANSCEMEIVSQLIEMYHKKFEYMRRDGFVAEDEYFYATQNARLVHDAERYYRAHFRGRPDSWNLRDKHMFDTLQDLDAHLSKRLGRPARIAVWAHNSHVGNSGATAMSDHGEFNIGQLVRHAYGKQALLVGFSTSRGAVTAASNWDEPAECKEIRAPIPGSYEDVFHSVSHKKFLLDMRENNSMVDLLSQPRLQRAIGVVYRPDTERQSHYFTSRLPQQFDFMLHFDSTQAVQPLDTVIQMHPGEMDETYPYGV